MNLIDNKSRYFIREYFLFVVLYLHSSAMLGLINPYLPFVSPLLLLLFLGVKKYKLKNKNRFYYIFFLGASYSFFAFITGYTDLISSSYYLISLLIYYMISTYLVRKYSDDNMILLFILIIFVFNVESFISIFNDILKNGFINRDRLIVTGSGEKSLSATLYGLKMSLFISGLSLIFVPTSQRKYLYVKFLLFVGGIGAIICVSHLINRTGIVLLFISLITILFYLLANKALKYKYLLLTLFVGVFMFSYFHEQIQNLIFAYDYRNEYSGSISTGGGRTDRWIDGLKCIIEQPFGGGRYLNGVRYYAHNLWLDIIEVSGVIAVFFMLVISLDHLRKIYKIIKYNKGNLFQRYFYLSFYLAFHVSFMTEPIIEGGFVYFCLYIMFYVMTVHFYKFH